MVRFSGRLGWPLLPFPFYYPSSRFPRLFLGLFLSRPVRRVERRGICNSEFRRINRRWTRSIEEVGRLEVESNVESPQVALTAGCPTIRSRVLAVVVVVVVPFLVFDDISASKEGKIKFDLSDAASRETTWMRGRIEGWGGSPRWRLEGITGPNLWGGGRREEGRERGIVQQRTGR